MKLTKVLEIQFEYWAYLKGVINDKYRLLQMLMKVLNHDAELQKEK